jgi:signal transduction histidine kinase
MGNNYFDNGPEISCREYFSRVSNLLTTKKNGTGLGLSVCKKLCSENKALITAKSPANGGTSFIISGAVENES